MRRVKTDAELLASFYMRKADIKRAFNLGRDASNKCFREAQKIDEDELKHNYFDTSAVRTSTVLKVLGISRAEFERNLKKAPVAAGTSARKENKSNEILPQRNHS